MRDHLIMARRGGHHGVIITSSGEDRPWDAMGYKIARTDARDGYRHEGRMLRCHGEKISTPEPARWRWMAAYRWKGPRPWKLKPGLVRQ
jgi:hypothetical protein